MFTDNHFYNGNAHRGNAIRLEQKYDKFISFFDLNVDRESLLSKEEYEEERNFILLKKDLDKYMMDVENIFKNPPNEFIYCADCSEDEEDYENIKIQINKDFEKLKNEYIKLTESFFKFKMFCKMDSNALIYLLPEIEEVEKFFSLLRKMTIPKYTFISFFKLKKNTKIIYYMNFCSIDDKMTLKELNKDLSDLVIDFSTIKQLWASLNAGQNVILTGIPGTGKTHLATISAEEVMGKNGYVLTTATSDWTTFDTIGGLIPKDDGKLEFREGKFLQSIRENKWLIIDEINRADIDKAFGQLFTVLSGQNVELPYYIQDDNSNLIPIKIKTCDEFDSFYDEINATYYIGKNWRIIATMNSYDKNALFDLSYAFMRRFIIIEIGVPNKLDAFIKKLKNKDGDIIFDKFSEEFKNKLENLYQINTEHEDIGRKLGPAIFLDILKYVYSRIDLEGDECLDEQGKYKYNNDIFSEALISYIIPQFEGLHSTQRNLVENFLKKDVFGVENSDLVINKLNDMKSY